MDITFLIILVAFTVFVFSITFTLQLKDRTKGFDKAIKDIYLETPAYPEWRINICTEKTQINQYTYRIEKSKGKATLSRTNYLEPNEILSKPIRISKKNLSKLRNLDLYRMEDLL